MPSYCPQPRAVSHGTQAFVWPCIRVCALTLALSQGTSPDLSAASPESEQRSFLFTDSNLVVELVAAEPDVRSPVAMTWDAQGRLYVAEMRDYPSATTGGSVRLLVDKDGDGTYENSRVFADNLSFPNSVLAWKNGILVTAAPDLWYLKDTDGDGKADERRVLYTGFGKGNQQLRANGLFWGLDGWVYGANGRSDGEISRPGSTNRWSLRGRDFRFRPATGDFETLAGRCQFGHARDDWGHRFLSWNTIPVRHEVFPDIALAGAVTGVLNASTVLADCLPDGDSGEVFPRVPPPRVFNNESGSHFNALSGLHVYRGGALGTSYVGNAFVGESLLSLVHRRALVPEGPTFRAERTETGREFLASSDAWFHPVNFATGPDDALYVADFYRQFVEHPDWVARDTRDSVDWSVGKDLGRIWRIRSRSNQTSQRSQAAGFPASSVEHWVKELESGNSWRRDTAHRLLLERGERSVAKPLTSIARNAATPESRVLAMHLIQALGIDTTDVLKHALQDPDSRVRAVAVRLFVGQVAFEDLARLAHDSSERVRLEVALAAAGLNAKSASQREQLLEQLAKATTNSWIRLAAASSSRDTTTTWISALIPKPPAGRPPPSPREADPDREKVLRAFQSALQLTPDRSRGAATFARLCLSCHYLQGQGQRVGPDLSGISTRPIEALLIDVLDPSRQVTPDFAAYEVITSAGDTWVGMISSESATRMTLRLAGSPDVSVARSQVREIRPTGRSLMPDGLEQGLSAQDLADLLGFLRQPEAGLLPK